jgi:transcriptional regulator with XRE-family HTH domain
MSKPPGFPEYLADAIARAKYPTPTDFARAAGVHPSIVSRWLSGQAVPTVRTLEKIAPHLRVNKNTLIAIAYPDASVEFDAVPERPAPHPLALDVERMLADDSPVPDDERATLATLIEHMVAPYRRYLRKRRAS